MNCKICIQHRNKWHNLDTFVGVRNEATINCFGVPRQPESFTKRFLENGCLFLQLYGHIATIPLKDQRTINVNDVGTTICLPDVTDEIRKTSWHPSSRLLCMSNKKMCGQQLLSSQAAVEPFSKHHVLEIQPSEWKICFKNWFKRLQKCIKLIGEYFEHNKTICTQQIIFLVVKTFLL